MNNSYNSFNICPRCGNSNALSAKYCSRCGGQLKVPGTPIVCPKCHTHNSPMSKFCRNCGTSITAASSAKPTTQVASSGKATASKTQQPKAEKIKKQKGDKPEKVYSKKGGRGWAIAGIVLVLLFAYLIVAPYQILNPETGEATATLRPEFLAGFDKGIVNLDGVGQYGYDIVMNLVKMIQDIVGGANIGDVLLVNGVASIMLTVLTIVFIVTVLLHLIVCVVRTITGKRSKHGNDYFLAMAIISTLIVDLMLLFQYVVMPVGFLQTIAGWFMLGGGIEMGFVIYLIPVYFWFFYFYSLFAKAKKLQETE